MRYDIPTDFGKVKTLPFQRTAQIRRSRITSVDSAASQLSRNAETPKPSR